MKTFTKYVSDTYIDEALLYNDNLISESIDITEFVNEGKLLNWLKGLGSKSANAIHGVKKFTDKLAGYPAKTVAVYKITMKSLEDIKDDNEKENVEQLLSSYDNCNTADEIAEKNYEYLKAHENDTEKTKFFTGLAIITYDIMKQSSDKDLKAKSKEVAAYFKKSKPEVKKEIEQEVQQVQNNEAEDNKDNASSEGNKEAGQPTEKKVETKVDADPISTLTEKANINKEKMTSAIWDMLTNKDGEVKWDLENADNVILGLSAIISGGMLIKNEDVAGKILRACGIKFDKEFINRITEKTN